MKQKKNSSNVPWYNVIKRQHDYASVNAMTIATKYRKRNESVKCLKQTDSHYDKNYHNSSRKKITNFKENKITSKRVTELGEDNSHTKTYDDNM